MNKSVDGQKSRSMATQQALMNAAVKLIAAKGIENVSIREIVTEAGQKNESALQYHFGNLQGLIHAIQTSKEQETRQKRAELLKDLLTQNSKPTLRNLCRLMVEPAFLLASTNPDYRLYVIAFSHELALTPDSALSQVSKMGGGGKSGQDIGKLLRATLPHLDEAAYRQRMESAIRLSSISMGHHARQKNAFRGNPAAYFLSCLIDAITGLLSAPVSSETRALSR